jgi:hypothetical protein
LGLNAALVLLVLFSFSQRGDYEMISGRGQELVAKVEATSSEPDGSVAPQKGAAGEDDEPVASVVKGPVGDAILPYITKPYGITRTRHKRAMLVSAQPLWYMQPGLGYVDETDAMDMRDTLLLPPDTTRVCIDVGTYVSTPSSKRWWSRDPRTFVIAFEPNVFSNAMLGRVAHPIMHTQGRGYWPTCGFQNVSLSDSVHDCVGAQLAHVIENFNRFLLIPVALSYRNEFATFLVGFPGRPDGGSLLTFRPKLRKKKDPPSRIQVGIAQLFPYLRMIPAYTTPRPVGNNASRLLWDTLKIDAQGVDELVIEGGGMLLTHFACVIAELDLRAYNAGHRFEYLPFMIGTLKFIRVGRNTFINPRFRQAFIDDKVLCTAPDVHHTRDDILKALNLEQPSQ